MDGQTDRRTDGRTDGQTEFLYQYRASVCWRAIKMDNEGAGCGEGVSRDELMGFSSITMTKF